MKGRINLLIVDDEPEILNFLGMMFEENVYGVQMAESGDHALALLKQGQVDVLISDIRMPGMDGLELMRQAQQYDPELQYIFMSGHSDVDTAVIAMKEGAFDFLLKPVEFETLEKNVFQAVCKKKRKQERAAQNRELAFYQERLENKVSSQTLALEQANEALKTEVAARIEAERNARYLVYYDMLTGLPNRLLLRERLGQAVRKAKQKQEGLVLLMLDLDHLTEINNSLGRNAGDILLQEVGHRLALSLRRNDTVARMDGDEYVIILPKISSREHALTLIEKIEQRLMQPMQVEGTILSPSFSIGTVYFPDAGSEPELLLEKAEQEMYREKKRKKSAVR